VCLETQPRSVWIDLCPYEPDGWGLWHTQFRTGSPGALSRGACGFAKPIVPG
jgi:hypothetical protein